jgi:hypothetical protein
MNFKETALCTNGKNGTNGIQLEFGHKKALRKVLRTIDLRILLIFSSYPHIRKPI